MSRPDPDPRTLRRWQHASRAALVQRMAVPLLWTLLIAEAARAALGVATAAPALDFSAAGIAAVSCLAALLLIESVTALPARWPRLRATLVDAAMLLAGTALAWTSAIAMVSVVALCALVALVAAVVRRSQAHAAALLSALALVAVGANWTVHDDPAALGTILLLFAAAAAAGGVIGRAVDGGMDRRLQRAVARIRLARRDHALAEARARYIAAASHDLRQPLHALSFLSRAVAERHRGERELGQALRRIEQAAEASDRMFKDLVQLSQIDTTRLSLKLVEQPLTATFEALQSTFTPRATKKGLALQIYKTDLSVHSDAVALLRILSNLMSNAVRYTDHGLIELRAARVGDSVQIRVRDTGPGIAAEHREEIFEAFRQLRRDRGGAGLGLAIARRLADALGHALTLESEPGKGSAFTLTVPAAGPATGPPTLGAITTRGPGEERLLLFIDDDRDVRAAVKPVMESWGYTVVDAASGIEAEERLSALMTVPAVMVVDHDLSDGESAHDVVRRIREMYGASIPSLVVSGNPDTRPLDDGAPALLKPVDPRRLRAAVETARRSAARKAADRQP